MAPGRRDGGRGADANVELKGEGREGVDDAKARDAEGRTADPALDVGGTVASGDAYHQAATGGALGVGRRDATLGSGVHGKSPTSRWSFGKEMKVEKSERDFEDESTIADGVALGGFRLAAFFGEPPVRDRSLILVDGVPADVSVHDVKFWTEKSDLEGVGVLTSLAREAMDRNSPLLFNRQNMRSAVLGRLRLTEAELATRPDADEINRSIDRTVDIALTKAVTETVGQEVMNRKGKIDATARKEIKSRVLDLMKEMDLKTLSSDQYSKDTNVSDMKAVDSLIDVYILAKENGVMEGPDGMTEAHLNNLLTTLYLTKSGFVRMEGVELSHVPIVVREALAAHPQDPVLAFTMALNHDAGKAIFNGRTTSGFTVQPHSFMNGAGMGGKGVALEVLPGENPTEAFNRITIDESVLQQMMTADSSLTRDAAQKKLEGSLLWTRDASGNLSWHPLVSVLTHPDSVSVLGYTDPITGTHIDGVVDQLYSSGAFGRLDTDAGKEKAEERREKFKQAVKDHNFSSPWVLSHGRNAKGSFGIRLRSMDEHPNLEQLTLALKLKVDEGVSASELERDTTNTVTVTLDGQKVTLTYAEAVQRQRNETGKLDPSSQAIINADAEGQNEPGKYFTILTGVQDNAGRTAHEVLFGAEGATKTDFHNNSVDGVAAVTPEEIGTRDPVAYAHASAAFGATRRFLSSELIPSLERAMDPKDKDYYVPGLKEAYDASGAKTIEAWLKSDATKPSSKTTVKVTIGGKEETVAVLPLIGKAIDKGFFDYTHHSPAARLYDPKQTPLRSVPDLPVTDSQVISAVDISDNAMTGVYEVFPLLYDQIVDMEPIAVNLDTALPQGRTMMMVRMGERTVVLNRNGADSKIYVGSAEGVSRRIGPGFYFGPIDPSEVNKGWIPVGDGVDLMIDGSAYTIY